jgi:hypothetical protein
MMHEFPHQTLEQIQVMVNKLDTEKERYMQLVNDIALYSEVYASRVSNWAHEIRMGTINEKI